MKGKIKMLKSAGCFHEGKNYGLSEGETYSVPADCPSELAEDLIRAGHAEQVKTKAGSKKDAETATSAEAETPETPSESTETATAAASESPEE